MKKQNLVHKLALIFSLLPVLGMANLAQLATKVTDQWTYAFKDYKSRKADSFFTDPNAYSIWDGSEESPLHPFAPDLDALADLAAFVGIHSRTHTHVKTALTLSGILKMTDAFLGARKPYHIGLDVYHQNDSKVGGALVGATGGVHSLMQGVLAYNLLKCRTYTNHIAQQNKMKSTLHTKMFRTELTWQIALTVAHYLFRIFERNMRNTLYRTLGATDDEVEAAGQYLGPLASLTFLLHAYQQKRLNAYYLKKIYYATHPEREANESAKLDKKARQKRSLLQRLSSLFSRGVTRIEQKLEKETCDAATQTE